MPKAEPKKRLNRKPCELPVIAIDFDGVIHDYKHPVEGRRMGGPMPGAVNAMQNLEDDFTVVIYTTKATTEGGKKAVEDWLEYYHVPYGQVTAIKPNAVLFVDDRALRFYDWDQASAYINDMLEEANGPR